MCVACRHGDYGYCENISFTYRMGDGAMADYVKVHEPYVYRLPDNMSFATGALVEPLAVAVHATRRADVKLGDRVAVFGGGAIGVLIAALSRRFGAAEVTVVDFDDPRLDLARSFGATRVLNPQHDDVLDQLDRIDKSFECVGVPDTLRQAMLCLRKNGLATVVGIAEVTDVAIPVSRFITHEIKVQGSQGYCWDFPTALACAQELEIERLITHTFSLDELQIALDTCLNRASDVLKVIIEP
jgi:threonine dehydrogenase-like Zn-dependent dehydrogenase